MAEAERNREAQHSRWRGFAEWLEERERKSIMRILYGDGMGAPE